ncbi:thyrotropin-releasing hormone receptor [Plakobranchus ocellatus]|uniref:Thyrotropin-releasing hormone receptor n=1 Tax=Plakobranchus ocellatus TaxID=259542 RepID=A0AAV3ZJ94_9GAST|nr:thyrotropin-releasing hormone receptor [Plakobranchus ocellatus]
MALYDSGYYSDGPGPSSIPDVVFHALHASAASVTSASVTLETEISYSLGRNETVLALPGPPLTQLIGHNADLLNSSSLENPGIVSFSGESFTTMSPSQNGSSNPLDAYTLYRVALYINRYYLWVVFAFGFPGNIVSFLTIVHMKPFTSPTIYVAALALVDNSCLLVKVIFFLLTKYDAPLGNTGCRTLGFLGSFTAQLANWLLVAMTLERCLAICLPLRVGTICTRKLHIAGITLTCIILVAINAQALVTNVMVTGTKRGIECSPDPEYADFLAVWFWVDAVFYAILPAALLIVMNSLIILGIRRSAQIQKELTSKANQTAETMKQQKQITIMLVIVCIVFVVLITPHALFYAVQRHWKYRPYSEEHARYLFTNQLIFVLSDSTHAVNFYLYFFSAKRFRKRCLETLFYCCYCCRWSRSRGAMGSRRRNRMYYGGSTTGLSKSFRLSMTDVTGLNTSHRNLCGAGGGAMYGETSHLTSSSTSLGNGRFLTVNNGDSARIPKRGRKHRDELV